MRRHIRYGFQILTFATAFPTIAWAQPGVEGAIGPAIAHFDYREPSIMHDRGTLYGVQGYVSFHNPWISDRWMKRVEGSYLEGKVDYSSTNTGSMSDVSDYLFEIRGLLGPELPAFRNAVVTPYTGFGYRYLNDDSSHRKTTTGHWGYEREQTYFYLPLGAMVQLADSIWSVEGQIEYDYLLEGQNNSYLSTVQGYPDISVKQHDGYGLRAALNIRHQLALGIVHGISFSPYIKYWNIEKSTVDSGFYEPANHSTEYGVVVAANF